MPDFQMMFLRGLLILIFTSSVGCALVEKSIEKPKVNLQQVYIEDATLNDAVLVFNFFVENPNKFPLNVDQVDYNINFNGKPFTKGVMDRGFKVDSQASAVVPLPIKIKFSDFFGSISELISLGKAPYQIEGSIKMGLLNIPFKEVGEVKIGDLK